MKRIILTFAFCCLDPWLAAFLIPTAKTRIKTLLTVTKVITFYVNLDGICIKGLTTTRVLFLFFFERM